MKRLISIAAALAFTAGSALAQGELDHLPLLEDIAPAMVPISDHIPHMGMHFADLTTVPLGPIYCVIEGRIVCIEYMFTSAEFAAGIDWVAIPVGFETPPIDHIDLQFQPNGVGPFAEPLYQLHLYFVSKDFLAQH